MTSNPDFDIEENDGDDNGAPFDPTAPTPLERTPDGQPREAYRMCAPGYTRMRMHVSYDGTDFAGWQRQKQSHLLTCQGSLEKAISTIAGEFVRVLGASRTDAGVHANAQVAHFDFPKDPTKFDFQYSIQCLTPKTLVVKDLFIAPRNFHAIALVEDKIYKYRVLNRRVPSALRRHFTYWVRHDLDLDYLNEASQFFVGQKDFKAFQGQGTEVKSTVRTVSEARWERLSDDTLEFTIRGDGFLKQMVRNIVGTVIDLNQDRLPASKVAQILASCDRRQAGPTAPPQGLFLNKVNYPESVDNECRKL